MRIWVRGWRRDCGPTVIKEVPLSELESSEGPPEWFQRSKNYVFVEDGDVVVATQASVQLNGDYLVKVSFTPADVAKLAGAAFGNMLWSRVVGLFRSQEKDQEAAIEKEAA